MDELLGHKTDEKRPESSDITEVEEESFCQGVKLDSQIHHGGKEEEGRRLLPRKETEEVREEQTE